MKKICFVLIIVLLLSGCQAAQTFEGVQDVYGPQQQAAPRKIELDLPKNAQTVAGSSGDLYLCDGYDVTVETFPSGDLPYTIQTLTGFAPNALTMLQTSASGVDRYECVWTAAGENGETVGRAVILDDGQYHYCVTVMAQAEGIGKLADAWQELLGSVHLN